MARRLGAIAAGVVIVSGTFTGAAFANDALPGVPGVGTSDGSNGGLLGGFGTLLRQIPLVGGGSGGGAGGTSSSNAQACGALADKKQAQDDNIETQAAAVNDTSDPKQLNQGVSRLSAMDRQARQLSNTMSRLGCSSSTPLIDIGTLITNPCLIVNGNNASGSNTASASNSANPDTSALNSQSNGASQANGATQSNTGSCTYDYSRNSASAVTTTSTTPSTDATALSTLTPNVVSSLPTSQISGSAVPVGGVNTGGSEGP